MTDTLSDRIMEVKEYNLKTKQDNHNAFSVISVLPIGDVKEKLQEFITAMKMYFLVDKEVTKFFLDILNDKMGSKLMEKEK